MKRICRILILVFSMLALAVGFALAENGVLRLPENLTTVSSEAFYNTKSIDTVYVPDGARRIESLAFAKSSLKTIYLPDTINYIAGNAFDQSSLTTVIAYEGTWAYNWATQKGYIVKNVNSASDFEYTISNGKCTITKYIGTANEVYIPSVIDGTAVTSIKQEAFRDCKKLTDVVIPDSVTSIGWYAFSGCSNLTSVVIPDSVTSIGQGAFCNCSNLTSVVIPDNVINIEYYTFYYCSSLTSVVIPDSVTSIWQHAFENCSSLTSVVIPDSVTMIEWYAFKGCSSLTSIVIPKNVTFIGLDAFCGCSSLKSVVIPDSVTNIGGYAFKGCSSLTSVVIPDSVTNIGRYAFKGCSSLTSVVIPDSVTSIGGAAFEGCSSLKSVVIPDNVTNIEYYTFYKCSSLTSVVVPDSVTSIEEYVFSGCSSLKNVVIPDSVTSIGESAFDGCSSLTSVVIPDSVTSIKANEFWGCSSLTSVVIPDSVTSIGQDAFRECSSLKSVVIPDSVTSIGDYTFWGCSSLKSVVIPDGVTSIGYNAFRECSSLKSVVIPDSVTSIKANEFWGCSSLTSVVIPDSVTSIGSNAFLSCDRLNTVNIPASVTTIGTDAFPSSVTITGIAGSYAEVYANEHNIRFVPIGTLGTGSLYGNIVRASDRSASIANAQISLYQNGNLYRSAFTSTQGSYDIKNLPVGNYSIRVEATGYVPFTGRAVINDDEITYMETFLLVQGSAGQTGHANGTITDAITGNVLAKATLKIIAGWDSTLTGSGIVTTVSTDSNGHYNLNLPLGYYTVVVQKEGYMESSFNIFVSDDGSASGQDGMISTTILPDQWRIILTWGESPRDLDAHMVGTLCNGDSFHVYYSQKYAYEDEATVCHLDVDDTTGNGREIITLSATNTTPYYYYVLHYSGSGSFSTSGARVEVYKGNARVTSFNVPTNYQSGVDWVWNVFSIIDGKISVQNTITRNPQTPDGFTPTNPDKSGMRLPDEIHIGAGSSRMITPTFSDSSRHIVMYTSTNPEIATVDSSGVVTAGNKIGETTIEANALDDQKLTAVCKVYVDTEFTVAGSNTAISKFIVGKQEIEKINIVYMMYEGVPISTDIWSSDNTGIARVDDGGNVKGISAGETYITCSNIGNGLISRCKVIVSRPPTEIVLDYDDMKLGVDESRKISVSTPGTTWRKFNYVSNDPAVAAVSEDGIITGKKFGNTQIVVSAGQVSATMRVIVMNKPTGMTIAPSSVSIIRGLSENLRVSFNYNAFGTPQYASSDPNVATVDQNGTVYGNKAGNAIITATTYVNGLTARCSVKVYVDSQYESWKEATDKLKRMQTKPSEMNKLLTGFANQVDVAFSETETKIQNDREYLINCMRASFKKPYSASNLPSSLIRFNTMQEDVYNWIITSYVDVLYKNESSYTALSKISNETKFIKEMAKRTFQGKSTLTYHSKNDNITYTWNSTNIGEGVGVSLSFGDVTCTLPNNTKIMYPVVFTTQNFDVSKIKGFMQELHDFGEDKLEEARKTCKKDILALIKPDGLLDFDDFSIPGTLDKIIRDGIVQKVSEKVPKLEKYYNTVKECATQYNVLQESYNKVKNLVNLKWSDAKVEPLLGKMEGYTSTLSKWEKNIGPALKMLGM